MAINAVKLDATTYRCIEDGLAELPLETYPLSLHSLGTVVLIAGANGAGKSRLLRLIASLAGRKMSEEQLAKLHLDLARKRKDLVFTECTHDEILSGEQASQSELEKKGRLIENEKVLGDIRKQISELEKAIIANKILDVPNSGPLRIIDFVPKIPNLDDPAKINDSQALQRTKSLLLGRCSESEKNAPAYARSVLRSAMQARDNARNRALSIEESEDLAAEGKLIEIIHDLLGESFHFSLNKYLNLKMGRDDVESYQDELSQGQQILFQLACMLHAQRDQLKNSIILMDEPENHLHPAALNDVIDRIRSASGVSQLWLATHSVPLISHLIAIDPDCLWYAESGQISKAGRSPSRVLESLMGGAEGAKNLRSLTRLPAEYAVARFLSECLLEPGVVGPNIKDPQTNQISGIIKNVSSTIKRPLRIVDYGAGVGRLLATLTASAPNNEAGNLFDYWALEPDEKKHPELKSEIKNTYDQDASNRIFSDDHQLKSKLDPNSIDIIVMCNVLHEIPPDDWIPKFSANSSLMSRLSESGYLLIVEDYGIPVGERAHSYGFFLMDEGELVSLFDIKEADREAEGFIRVSSNQEKYKSRLVAHLISKNCVTRISNKSKIDAIRTLRDRMKTRVSSYLRSATNSTDDAAARDYARSSQLYVNSMLWLSDNGAEEMPNATF